MWFCRSVVAVSVSLSSLLALDGAPSITENTYEPTHAPEQASAVVPTLTPPPGISPASKPDVIYLPTKADVVSRMLGMAQVRPGDIVYDLGSGDGRIPIQAVRDFAASFGVGIEIDAKLVAESRQNAVRAGVGDRVDFVNQSFFTADFSRATVVTLYLIPEVNQKLAPLLRKLKPGTRIVSHDYGISPDWPPDEVQRIRDNAILLFTVRQGGSAR